jgi:pimeloyl-ACP methyl ester carboxylesterase
MEPLRKKWLFNIKRHLLFMKKRPCLLRCLLIQTLLPLSFLCHGQYAEQEIAIPCDSDSLYGTLTLPDSISHPPLILLIAGSGPTDRDGNNTLVAGKNNSLKMLAHDLASQGIASLRYDKRGIGASRKAARSLNSDSIDEASLTFDDFVTDALSWVGYFSKSTATGPVFIAGHSEGSLIAIQTARLVEDEISGIISIAGPGRSFDTILIEQLSAGAPFLVPGARQILDSMTAGVRVDTVPPMLNSLFRPSVQPFLISLLKYHPAQEIAALSPLPTLILQGTHDLQITPEDARALSDARPDAKVIEIRGMNHILKSAPAERLPNLLTYSQPDLPLAQGLVEAITAFVNETLSAKPTKPK